MLGKKLGIDLGSSMIRVVARGEGLMVSEPSVVLADGASPPLMGREALERERHSGIPVSRPIERGRLRDPAGLAALLQLAVTRAAGRQRIFKPDMVIVVMSELPGEERRTLLEMAAGMGARTVYLLDSPMAVSMGCHLAPEPGRAHLVIDAGAGTTEVSALVEEGSLAGRCLPGGSGLDELLNLPGSDDHAEAHAAEIASAVAEVVAEVPSPLRDSIRREGIVLGGGAASMAGLEGRLAARTGLGVRVPTDPALCAVRGAGIAVEHLDVVRRNVMYLR